MTAMWRRSWISPAFTPDARTRMHFTGLGIRVGHLANDQDVLSSALLLIPCCPHDHSNEERPTSARFGGAGRPRRQRGKTAFTHHALPSALLRTPPSFCHFTVANQPLPLSYLKLGPIETERPRFPSVPTDAPDC